MIADIGDDGKQKVQYIHWVGGTSTIQLSEIMCYEKPRLYAGQVSVTESDFNYAIQPKNGPILTYDRPDFEADMIKF